MRQKVRLWGFFWNYHRLLWRVLNQILFLAEILFLLFANSAQRSGINKARGRVGKDRKYTPFFGSMFFLKFETHYVCHSLYVFLTANGEIHIFWVVLPFQVVSGNACSSIPFIKKHYSLNREYKKQATLCEMSYIGFQKHSRHHIKRSCSTCASNAWTLIDFYNAINFYQSDASQRLRKGTPGNKCDL